MARRGMTGQLNMFDLIHSLENGVSGEVEMVSLVPTFEEEPAIEVEIEMEPVVEAELVIEVKPETEKISEIEEIPEVEEIFQNEKISLIDADMKVAMSRKYEIEGEIVEIAYINYNKVRISRGKNTPEIIEFATTKEAVDYYVKKIQELEIDE